MGYGLAGNNRIGSYNSLATLGPVFTAVGNGPGTGYATNRIPNEKLKWEANKTFNFGLDFGFFNQRLTISPSSTSTRVATFCSIQPCLTHPGYRTMIINAGKTKNQGIDLTINSVNIDKPSFTFGVLPSRSLTTRTP